MFDAVVVVVVVSQMFFSHVGCFSRVFTSCSFTLARCERQLHDGRAGAAQEALRSKRLGATRKRPQLSWVRCKLCTLS